MDSQQQNQQQEFLVKVACHIHVHMSSNPTNIIRGKGTAFLIGLCTISRTSNVSIWLRSLSCIFTLALLSSPPHFLTFGLGSISIILTIWLYRICSQFSFALFPFPFFFGLGCAASADFLPLGCAALVPLPFFFFDLDCAALVAYISLRLLYGGDLYLPVNWRSYCART